MDENWKELADAIVIKAVDDYWQAKRQILGLTGKKATMNTESRLIDAERFLRSKWFRNMTDLNAGYVIDKVNKEIESELQRKRR